MPKYQEPRHIERGVERLIEPNRTYRIQKDGYTTLLRVTEVGTTTVTLKDMSTGKVSKMNRSTFQNDLNQGKIYVSSSVSVANFVFQIELLTGAESGRESQQMSTTHVYSLDQLKIALLDPEPDNPKISFYDDDMNYGNDELVKDLKKELPGGFDVSQSNFKVTVKKKFSGPAQEAQKPAEKKWADPAKEEFEKLMRKNKSSKPGLKVLKSNLLKALAKVVQAGEVIDFKPFLRKHKGRPSDGLDEPTSIEIEGLIADIADAIKKDPKEAAELAVDLIFKVTEGGTNERYIKNFLAVLKGFPYQDFIRALKKA